MGTDVKPGFPGLSRVVAWLGTRGTLLRRALIAMLAILVLWNAGELKRRVYYWSTGAVPVNGLVFHVDPEDQCIAKFLLEDGVWEPAETALLLEQLAPGDTVVDVGANIGWYTVLASRAVGEDGLVIAFEPDPTNFELLRRNVEANGCHNVRLERKALSNERGTIELFLHNRNKGMHSALAFQTPDGSIEVEAIPLDDYLADVPRPIDFVKIDVEGAEGMVLEGMRETLVSNAQLKLLVEFAPKRLRRSGCDPRQLLEDFVDADNAILQIDPSQAMHPVTSAQQVIQRLDREEIEYTNLFIRFGDTSTLPRARHVVTAKP